MVTFKQNLTIRHLRLLETLARELSISRCAEVLHTSQSAISRGLAEIEALLGARLFERTTRRVMPTPLGQNLIWHAEQILGQLDRAEADFQALSQGIGSAVDIGIQGGFSPPLLVRAVQLANEQAPKLVIRLRANFAEGLIPDLVRGRYNLVITHLDVRQFANEELVVEVLYQEQIGVLAAPGHPHTRRRRLHWKDLVEDRWAMIPAETSTRRIVERNLLLHAPGRTPIIVEALELHYVVSLVREAGMLTALPLRLARWFDAELGVARVLPLEGDAAGWSVCVARLRSRRLSPAETLFLNCLRTACAGQEESG
ncbi:LysR family transcriptional regulator [Roseomonas sp. NAR14]|uniref:LysR family transcriptional regulator n=1 Tax=Roseomonas acroporae TaxID=2937791 RepID=A0A9X1Y7X0_9PROT|nr:LysR family transcriptional regulator [Roseomonas acroporae]MCK8784750.1 LysR family transcriptional regulator [Roseomonas acroporae]